MTRQVFLSSGDQSGVMTESRSTGGAATGLLSPSFGTILVRITLCIHVVRLQAVTGLCLFASFLPNLSCDEEARAAGLGRWFCMLFMDPNQGDSLSRGQRFYSSTKVSPVYRNCFFASGCLDDHLMG